MTAFLRFDKGVVHGGEVRWDDSGDDGWPPPEFINVVYGPRSGMSQFVDDGWRRNTEAAAAVEDGSLLHTRYRRATYSIIPDGEAAEMNHVIRGAQYEAVEGHLEKPPPIEVHIVKCKDCGREYACTPDDDYYNESKPGAGDGVCMTCLLVQGGMGDKPVKVIEVDT